MTAAGAETIEFESVGLDDEAVTRGDFVLQLFDFTIFKLDDLAAAGADQMIVMTLMGDVIVLRLGAKMPGLRDPGVAKQIERPINGRQPQMRVGLGELVIHRFGSNVLLP